MGMIDCNLIRITRATVPVGSSVLALEAADILRDIGQGA